MKSATVYLSLGCNIGNCAANLAAAVSRLDGHEDIDVTLVSSVYITDPVGELEQPDFLNIALALQTRLAPAELLAVTRDIEIELGGRDGRVPNGPRTMDIDILMYDQDRISTADLVLPHPRLLERTFVLAPLAEIAPDTLLPDGQTAAQAVAALDETHSVEKTGQLPG
ncbi:MAG: 2-amino-4-hydroxy-6-hydroxymethyldihydropteridine diphosphokinase [Thermoleophilia bacterium]